MQTYSLDPHRTSLVFAVHRLLGTRGAFARVSGAVTADDMGSPQSVDVTIAAASLTTALPPRDAHLRSADFLAAARYPTAAFTSHSIEQATPDRYLIHGSLRIKGREHPVTLEAMLDAGPAPDDGLRVQVRGSFSRAPFGIPGNPVIAALVRALVGETVFARADVFLVPIRAGTAADIAAVALSSATSAK